jgi:hypothetical protein
MRRLAPVLALAAVMAIAGTVVAKQQSGKLTTFGTGDATFSGSVLTLDNDAGEYSGVYLKSTSRKARPIAAVHFSFDYSGTVAGGAPRFSIPLDTDRNGRLDGYAFLDANNCGLTGSVSTSDDSCQVFLNFGNISFANWDAMVAAHGDWRLAPGKVPFIIADQPGIYEISNIDLR